MASDRDLLIEIHAKVCHMEANLEAITERLDKVEAKTASHSAMVYRGIGFLAGVSLLAGAIGSKISKLFHD